MPPRTTVALRLAVPLMIAASLAACGGDGSTFESVRALAEAIGCADLDVGSDEIFVREGGDCTYEGADVTLYMFNSADARDSWLEIARGFGFMGVVGENWVVSLEDSAVAEEIAQKIGGEVQ